jgi:hypothetical protein
VILRREQPDDWRAVRAAFAAARTPGEVAAVEESYTGSYLHELLPALSAAAA